MDPFIQDALHELRRVDILSLDIFDTCLLRRVAQPTDVFTIIEHLLAENPRLRRLSGGRFAFRSLRIRAEEQARKRLYKASRTYEVSLDDIYAEVRLLSDLSEAQAQELRALELETEQKALVPNPTILALVKLARERGKRVVFVSDMYLPPVFVMEALGRAGFAPSPGSVFVSCAYGKGKWTGDLFDVVASETGAQLRRFLHIGDHPEADVAMPRKRGAHVLHYRKPLDEVVARDGRGREQPRDFTRPTPSLALGVRDGVLALDLATGGGEIGGEADDFWFRLGYERVGILLLGLTQWLIEQCLTDHVDHLLFLARDGYIMQQAFDYLCRKRGVTIRHTYMFGSRRALVFPAIFTTDVDDLSLLAAGVHMPVRNYLVRHGLDPLKYEQEARDAGFESLDQKIDTAEEFAQLSALFTRVTPELLNESARESQLVLSYFDQIPLARTGHIGLVDIGWHGSVQEGFTKLLRLSGRACDVTGYYLGLYEPARHRVAKGHVMKGYLTQMGVPEDVTSWIQESVELIEFLFLAPHGSCVGFTQRDGAISPILQDDGDEWENITKALRVQAGAMKFIEAAAPIIEAFPTIGLDARGAFYPYAQTILSPTYTEARILGDLTHEQNVGQGRWYLANPDAIRKGKTARDAIFWKRGYQRRVKGK